MSEKDDYWEKCYWPFDVLPTNKQTDQHRHEITFLDTAYRNGFRSFVFGSGSMGAESDQRKGEIIWRGRMRWEIVLTTTDMTKLSAYLDDFECAAKAVMDWLGGVEHTPVLEDIKSHLVRMSGARHSFQLYDPT
jgi:hypothetical protein